MKPCMIPSKSSGIAFPEAFAFAEDGTGLGRHRCIRAAWMFAALLGTAISVIVNKGNQMAVYRSASV